MAAPHIIDTKPRKAPKLTRWVAKQWRPEYERMVAYSSLGWSNIKIGQEMGYTPVHVSNVLNLPLAKELKQKLMERMRAKTMESIPDMMEKISQNTTERLLALVEDDEQFAKSPFAIIDRGLDIMKGTGKLKGGGNGSLGTPVNQQNNFFNLPAHLVDRLANGMKMADRALEINAPASTEEG